MPDPSLPSDELARLRVDIVKLAKATRFALVGIVLILSCISIRSSLAILGFEQLFKDMLNGRAMPPITSFVFTAYPVFILFSLLVPLLAIGALFSRRYAASIYLLGILLVLTTVQLTIISQGLLGPLFQIINAMQGMQSG